MLPHRFFPLLNLLQSNIPFQCVFRRAIYLLQFWICFAECVADELRDGCVFRKGKMQNLIFEFA
ncbi:hypothetical protein WK32_08170 [Burkholderia vietnamiensis]|nr:hypothetical protein WK32_08170 [Burkholderia vietnamiensis]